MPVGHDHHPDRIAERLAEPPSRSLLGDAVLGAMDGSVTTFALVAGAWGAGLGAAVALTIGIAKLFADACSMAISNLENVQAEAEARTQIRLREREEIREFPEGEREEVRQILARFGLRGETLDRAVEAVTSDPERWVELMLREEHGMGAAPPRPWSAAGATFGAFVLVGGIPLLPFLATPLVPALQTGETVFVWSLGLTALAFLGIGYAKAHMLGIGPVQGALRTLGLGALASGVAWGTARLAAVLTGVAVG